MEKRMEGTLRALSHDMRAPLDNVIALVTLSLERLKEGAKGGAESIVPYLRKILVAANDMEMMIRELMEDGTGAQEERFGALDLAESVRAAVGAMATEKRQTLTIDMSGLGSAEMTGNGAALRRILINLMGNAVKYTQEEGTIRLTGKGGGEKHGAMTAEFVVEDNGTGMDAAFMTRMYEPFARSAQAMEGDEAGYGLGLAIVRQLTERMNGTICVQSEPGRGTRFSLCVPLRTQAARAQNSLAGKHLLLAEDNDLSAEIEQEILRMQGARVCRAKDGAQAAAIFSAHPAGAFDAVLMDMHMPGMDGLSAAAAIRAMARPDAGSIPILALTAGGDARDERQAAEAGMNGCLKKPLDAAMVCRALEEIDECPLAKRAMCDG